MSKLKIIHICRQTSKIYLGIMRPPTVQRNVQRKHRKFPFTLSPVFPNNIQHNYSTPSIQETGTGTILSTKLQILFGFHQFLHTLFLPFFFFFWCIQFYEILSYERICVISHNDRGLFNHCIRKLPVLLSSSYTLHPVLTPDTVDLLSITLTLSSEQCFIIFIKRKRNLQMVQMAIQILKHFFLILIS